MRGNGGIIGKPNVPTTSIASGVWGLREVTSAVRNSIWPAPTPAAATITFVQYYQNLSSDVLTATQSFTSCDLGASVSGNKRVVITVGYNQGGGAAAGVGISSATIAGTSATIIESLSTAGQERSAVIYADITGSTTTGTVSLTYNSAFTSSNGSQGTIIGIYYITNPSLIKTVTSAFSHRNNSLGAHSATVSTATALVVASAAIGGSSSNNTITWTNATEDYEYDPEPLRDDVFGGASMSSDGSTETISTSPNTEYGVLTLAAFNTVGIATYSYTGSTQTFNVPAGVTSISVKMWGAAGGSSDNSSTATSGAGGYAEATVDVTGQSTVTVYVGGGGSGAGAGAASTPGGWGYGSGGAGQGGGAGGGGSAITFSTTPVLVAGGGGGRSADDWDGGAGGGTNGQDGDGGSTDGIGGFGATGATGGGADLEDNADATAGGNAPGGNGGEAGGGAGTAGGAGGGGGYAGGGGGGGGSESTEGGGGGGSGYSNGTYCTSVTLTAGSGPTPGNSSDTDRPAGIAEGTSTTSADGGDGYVIITY